MVLNRQIMASGETQIIENTDQNKKIMIKYYSITCTTATPSVVVSLRDSKFHTDFMKMEFGQSTFFDINLIGCNKLLDLAQSLVIYLSSVASVYVTIVYDLVIEAS
jgi:hypothetical protein